MAFMEYHQSGDSHVAGNELGKGKVLSTYVKRFAFFRVLGNQESNRQVTEIAL